MRVQRRYLVDVPEFELQDLSSKTWTLGFENHSIDIVLFT